MYYMCDGVKKASPYLHHFKIHIVEAACALDVDAIHAHKGIGHDLAAIGAHRVGHGLRNNLYAQTGFDTDAVAVFTPFGGDVKKCHGFIVELKRHIV